MYNSLKVLTLELFFVFMCDIYYNNSVTFRSDWNKLGIQPDFAAWFCQEDIATDHKIYLDFETFRVKNELQQMFIDDTKHQV